MISAAACSASGGSMRDGRPCYRRRLYAATRLGMRESDLPAPVRAAASSRSRGLPETRREHVAQPRARHGTFDGARRMAPPVWLTGPVQPDMEEVPQVLAAVRLGEIDELHRARVAVGVLARPVAEDLEERQSADLLAQRLERHAPAVVDRAVEQVFWPARVARGRIPEAAVLGRMTPVERLEDLPRRRAPLVLEPE